MISLIWEIFEKHFLSYIKYPDSSSLQGMGPSRFINYMTWGRLEEETDLLDGINIFLRKKGNSLKRKVLNKAKENSNFILSAIETENKKLSRRGENKSTGENYEKNGVGYSDEEDINLIKIAKLKFFL